MTIKQTLLATVGMALCVACGSKTEQYAAADGTVTATHKQGSEQWVITDKNGREVVPQYDSMRVVEVSADGHPATVVYHIGNRQHWLQYYSTMQLRGEGETIGGLREGRWVFYHPNGTIQSECTYRQGKEEGRYTVFRENGMPYYIGQYTHGQRTGIWEVYDAQGNLSTTKEY